MLVQLFYKIRTMQLWNDSDSWLINLDARLDLKCGNLISWFGWIGYFIQVSG